MTKTEIFKKLSQLLKDSEYGDFDGLFDWLFENRYNCIELDSYIEDADESGYEHCTVYRVETFPDKQPFLHFHFSISTYCGGWNLEPQICEVAPYVTTKFKYVKNWTDDD